MVVISQEHPASTFNPNINTSRASPVNMSATAFNQSPATPQNPLPTGVNHTVNNTPPQSINTVSAHSVYPVGVQNPAPANVSASSFATNHDGGSQQSLPPMVAPEPGMTTSAYYGGAPPRHYFSQASFYQQSQPQQYQLQQQYDNTNQNANSHPQQAYHDGGYQSPVSSYQQQNGGQGYHAPAYGHTRSDSMISWQNSDDYDYDGPGSVGIGGGPSKKEPILMPGEEPLPRPTKPYAALIGEALLLAPPPHHLYVSEICASIRARYPCEFSFFVAACCHPPPCLGERCFLG